MERMHIGVCRWLQVEETPPKDMGDERSRALDFPGGDSSFRDDSTFWSDRVFWSDGFVYLDCHGGYTTLSSLTEEHTKKKGIHCLQTAFQHTHAQNNWHHCTFFHLWYLKKKKKKNR